MKSARKYGKPSLFIGLLLIPVYLVLKVLIDGPIAGSVLWMLVILSGYGVAAMIYVKVGR